MFLPGQKVVCVDDVFPAGIQKFYWKLPVKGVTYTVRDLIPGIDPSGEPGEMCVYLVELINPCSDKPPYPERGFKAERFRPLETDTETETAIDDVPEEVPAFVGELSHADHAESAEGASCDRKPLSRLPQTTTASSLRFGSVGLGSCVRFPPVSPSW